LCVQGPDEKSEYALFFLKDLENTCDLKKKFPWINLKLAMGAVVFFHRFHIENFITVHPTNIIS
jgi:hypothetical protein